ncbi:unnamed protein product [Ceratitis capitata]|uniref:(Mediterranean fruit fly) hypothetical protein n=1 Tax=Ceratitis capitata TaxID=7213 RepID=A0A811V905_CERCA|nr:unnamed protein product [Ceratitis capitata]
MCWKIVRWHIVIILYIGALSTDGIFRNSLVLANHISFNNIQCQSNDEKYFQFSQCDLKLQKRGYNELNIYGKLLKTADNITVKAELFRKTNGYTPFIYKFTLDFCDLKRFPQRQPVMSMFFKYLERNSNLNHTCPYDHDIILKNFVMPDDVLKLLPYPKGDYMVQLGFAAYNQWIISVKAFVKVAD